MDRSTRAAGTDSSLLSTAQFGISVHVAYRPRVMPKKLLPTCALAKLTLRYDYHGRQHTRLCRRWNKQAAP